MTTAPYSQMTVTQIDACLAYYKRPRVSGIKQTKLDALLAFVATLEDNVT